MSVFALVERDFKNASTIRAVRIEDDGIGLDIQGLMPAGYWTNIVTFPVKRKARLCDLYEALVAAYFEDYRQRLEKHLDAFDQFACGADDSVAEDEGEWR